MLSRFLVRVERERVVNVRANVTPTSFDRDFKGWAANGSILCALI